MQLGRIGAVSAPLLAVLVGLAALSPAHATTLRRMDLPQLVHKADRVVHARAVDRQVYWDASGTRIYTDTTFEVLNEAKGHGPRRLTVTLLGGRIDPAEMSAEGTPTFDVGEEVVLFTSPRPDGKKNLVGFSQGVMRVLEDRATGEKFATTEVFAGVTYLDVQDGTPVAARPVRSRAPLSSLLEHVRSMAESHAAGPVISDRPQTPVTSSPEGRRP